ncbi:TIGR04222 domain-containing membrane protein [Cryptosporangium phraense]|nr:TIGR04222 domain-containing membrane protein [Cryptosporangium phraense]
MTEDPPMWFTSADDRARAWLDRAPAPVDVALLAGGPGRVADVVLADLVASGHLRIGSDGGIELVSADVPADASLRAAVVDVVRRRPGCTVDDVRAGIAGGSGLRPAWGRLRRAGLLTRRLRYQGSARGPVSTAVVLGLGALGYVLLAALVVAVFDALKVDSPSGAVAAGIACLALLVGGIAALVLLTQWLSEVVPTTRGPVHDPRTPAGRRALDLLPDDGPYRAALSGASLAGPAPSGSGTSWGSYRWRGGRVVLRDRDPD